MDDGKCINTTNRKTRAGCSSPETCGLESKPIDTIWELLDWNPSEEKWPVAPLKAHVTLDDEGRGKVMVCHDMRGGYLEEDRYCKDHPDANAYGFYHWSLIDYFVYFSHHLVTVPTAPWINCAHLNGVPVLGTFITEGVGICEEFLWDQEIIRVVVSKLVEIATQHQFEGWLINVENQISPQHMENLLFFIKNLTHDMHQKIPGSKVIWYDSVIYPQGLVQYQNALNYLNNRFFEACDGIYLNYNWNSDLLKNSICISSMMNRNAEEIFVGVDCFGRGCFGGGGWNTSAAVTEIKKVSKHLSIAIFAPGWVHESLGSENFHENQMKFWSKLQLSERHVPSELPLETNFCGGFGHQYWSEGRVIRTGPWFNMMRHQLQSGWIFGENIQQERKMRLETQDAFCGGGCLNLRLSSASLPRDPVIIMKMRIVIPDAGIFCSLTHKLMRGDKTEKGEDEKKESLHQDESDGVPAAPHANLYSPHHDEFSVIFRTETLNPLATIAIGIRREKFPKDVLEFLSSHRIPDTICNGWITDYFFIPKPQEDMKSSLTSDEKKRSTTPLLSSVSLDFNSSRVTDRKSDPKPLVGIMIGQLKILASSPSISWESITRGE